MKLFCDAAFQNRCPRSYTDLPMKLGWIKEFATVSPCSQSCPVFELRFWCGCSRQGSPLCSSHLRQKLPLLPSRQFLVQQQHQQTPALPSMPWAAGWSFSTAKACEFFPWWRPLSLAALPSSLKEEDWSTRRLKDVSQQHLWSCCLALSHGSHSNPH